MGNEAKRDQVLIDYKIVIPGEPIAKERPRFASRDRNGKPLPFVRTYNIQENEEADFKWAVIQYLTKNRTGLFIIKGPVSVTCSFYMKRPKSHYGTGKNNGKLKQSAPYYHTKKKDIDNFEKFVFDCLNDLCWKDDSQIAESHAQKVYSENPRTEIQIRVLSDA